MKRQLFQVIRFLFQKGGLELRRARPTHDDVPRLAHFLSMRNIGTVIDVGANAGQFARSLLDAGFSGKVISIEPIPQMHKILSAAVANYAGRWEVGPPLALSDSTGTATFNVSANLASSSLLTVNTSSLEAAPESGISRTITVKTETLDKIFSSLGVVGPVFLKLDAQGAESAILRGARQSLPKIEGVKIELSLISLYEGQNLSNSLEELLNGEGFECWDIVPGFRNRDTGRLLQYDGIYFRPHG